MADHPKEKEKRRELVCDKGGKNGRRERERLKRQEKEEVGQKSPSSQNSIVAPGTFPPSCKVAKKSSHFLRKGLSRLSRALGAQKRLRKARLLR